MAICLRTVSSKLKPTSKFVPSRKHVGLAHLQRQLTQHISKSQFLEEVSNNKLQVFNFSYIYFMTFDNVEC